jgi:MoaA/NifB/PqqE/SkfB family radical SAM enzyme
MNKEYLLTESKSFCMLPWVHFNTSPTGDVLPCCIGKTPIDEFGYHKVIANSNKDSMMEIVNATEMKKLRVDMLRDVKNPICATCHKHDSMDMGSFRTSSNKQYGNYFDTAVTPTREDGSLTEFKMRYFDIRFSNICNFKCRTCGPDFSSQWEQENLKNNISRRIILKNNKKEFLQEVLDQIPHMEDAYFAGGEPLITEEHYIMLEEMIRQGRTDIALRYNTNFSNLKFKDKDLMGLWKKFKHHIQVYASVDHYGERAEYIRHGTNWADIEYNFVMAKKSPFIKLQMNTVLSLYNYKTFLEFYQYLFDKDLYPVTAHFSIYNMSSPEYLTSNVLPQHHKDEGRLKLLSLLDLMRERGFSANTPSLTAVNSIIDWTMAPSENTWEKYKEEFRTNTILRDNIRGESFVKTFPELADLMDDTV